jgi:hypothetical protein
LSTLGQLIGGGKRNEGCCCIASLLPPPPPPPPAAAVSPDVGRAWLAIETADDMERWSKKKEREEEMNQKTASEEKKKKGENSYFVQNATFLLSSSPPPNCAALFIRGEKRKKVRRERKKERSKREFLIRFSSLISAVGPTLARSKSYLFPPDFFYFVARGLLRNCFLLLSRLLVCSLRDDSNLIVHPHFDHPPIRITIFPLFLFEMFFILTG